MPALEQHSVPVSCGCTAKGNIKMRYMFTEAVRQLAAPNAPECFSSAAAGRARRVRHDQRNNQTVQAERLREDKDQDHADEELRLLGSGADTGVTDDANSSSSGHAAKADSHTTAEVREALLGAVVAVHCNKRSASARRHSRPGSQTAGC